MPTITHLPAAEPPNPAAKDDRAGQVPRLDSRTLFGQGKSVHIEHEGKLYELRVTRLGKLILTA